MRSELDCLVGAVLERARVGEVREDPEPRVRPQVEPVLEAGLGQTRRIGRGEVHLIRERLSPEGEVRALQARLGFDETHAGIRFAAGPGAGEYTGNF